MGRINFLFQLSVLLTGVAWSFILQAAPYEKIAQKALFNGETIFEYQFSNGLKVLFVPRHSAKVLTYQTWFNVGSLNEKLDTKLNKTGLAHLFEHMMFRGSEKFPDGRFEELTSRMGADRQNASTHFYRTNYFQSIPSKHLADLMNLEADRMKSLQLTADLFEKEKGAVVGEYRRLRESPSSVAFEELLKLAFDVAPYRFTVIGEESEIRGFTLEEAQYFYKTYYAPNNATLIVIGDAEEKELLSLVQKYYGDMKSQGVPKLDVPREPEHKAERRKVITHAQATSDHLLIAYPIPEVNSDETAAFSLLGAHLSSGMEGRLRHVLVDTGVAVKAVASSSNRPDFFEFFVQLTEKHQGEEAIRIVDREILRLQQSPISKQSFERALNQELLSMYSDLGDNSSLANFLGEYLSLSGNYLRGFEILDQYKKLTPKDLMAVSKKYFKPSRRSIVILHPEKHEKEKTKKSGTGGV